MKGCFRKVNHIQKILKITLMLIRAIKKVYTNEKNKKQKH